MHAVPPQVKYVKTGALCIARIATEKAICLELFDNVPQVADATAVWGGRAVSRMHPGRWGFPLIVDGWALLCFSPGSLLLGVAQCTCLSF